MPLRVAPGDAHAPRTKVRDWLVMPQDTPAVTPGREVWVSGAGVGRDAAGPQIRWGGGWRGVLFYDVTGPPS
jgi:hypothetical protein